MRNRFLSRTSAFLGQFYTTLQPKTLSKSIWEMKYINFGRFSTKSYQIPLSKSFAKGRQWKLRREKKFDRSYLSPESKFQKSLTQSSGDTYAIDACKFLAHSDQYEVLNLGRQAKSHGFSQKTNGFLYKTIVFTI